MLNYQTHKNENKSSYLQFSPKRASSGNTSKTVDISFSVEKAIAATSSQQADIAPARVVARDTECGGKRVEYKRGGWSVDVCACVYVRANAFAYVHIHRYIIIHVYMHTYTDTYTCVRTCVSYVSPWNARSQGLDGERTHSKVSDHILDPLLRVC